MFGHLFSSETGVWCPSYCMSSELSSSALKKTHFLVLATLSALSDISFLASHDSRKTYLLFGRKKKCSLGLSIAKKPFKMYNHKGYEAKR